MKKSYRAIFFDWDGTAVENREAPVDEVAAAMKPLLAQGIKLVIVSGTTYEKIAGGRLHTYFTGQELNHLYLGLGRGAYNYRFRNGEPEIFADRIPDREGLLQIHDVCYAIHRRLLMEYGLSTDIVFSRPNYGKIDLMVERARGNQLFMQDDEVEQLRSLLSEHGIGGGLGQLLALAEGAGRAQGMPVSATCDAKYLEVGISCKSDNVDTILKVLEGEGICPGECSFWGDEFVGIEEGLFGSDSFMHTDRSGEGDFFDVSSMAGERPEYVKVLGGGVHTFLDFLRSQR